MTVKRGSISLFYWNDIVPLFKKKFFFLRTAAYRTNVKTVGFTEAIQFPLTWSPG